MNITYTSSIRENYNTLKIPKESNVKTRLIY